MTQKQPIIKITEGVIWKQLLLFFFPILLGTFSTTVQHHWYCHCRTICRKSSTCQCGRFLCTDRGSDRGLFYRSVFGCFCFDRPVLRCEKWTCCQWRTSQCLCNLHRGRNPARNHRIFATPSMLRLMNTPDEIMQDSVIYLRFILSGIIFVFLL